MIKSLRYVKVNLKWYVDLLHPTSFVFLQFLGL